jgi:hypothetical protein
MAGRCRCGFPIDGGGRRREVTRDRTIPVRVAARPPTPRNKMLKARTRRKGKRCRRSAGWCVRKSTWAEWRLIALRRRNHVQTVAEPATGAVPGSPVPAASGVPESTMARLHVAGKGNYVVPMGRLPTDPVCLAGPWQRIPQPTYPAAGSKPRPLAHRQVRPDGLPFPAQIVPAVLAAGRGPRGQASAARPLRRRQPRSRTRPRSAVHTRSAVDRGDGLGDHRRRCRFGRPTRSAAISPKRTPV